MAQQGKEIAEREPQHPTSGNFLREIVFGANDGVVTSIGFLVGIAGSVAQQSIIVIAGVLTIVAGGASMALGNYLAVKSQKEFYDSTSNLKAKDFEKSPIISGIVIGFCYLVGGIPPILPFIYFQPTARALVMSFLVSVIVMVGIGIVRWILNKGSIGGKITETVAVGIIAAGIGFVAGEVLNSFGLVNLQ